MKTLAILGCVVAAVGFGFAMDTALTPQNAVAPVRPVVRGRVLAKQETQTAQAGDGCCAKRASAKSGSECNHTHEGDGCAGHSVKPEPTSGGCTRHLAPAPE